MILWDIIYSFFAKNVWGGYYLTSSGIWLALQRGGIVSGSGVGEPSQVGTFTSTFKIYGDLSLADWLNTTSTIIVLIALCVFLAFCVRYLFKFIGGLFKW